MTKQRGGKVRKPRVLRARPLLLGVGATLALAGCGSSPQLGIGIEPPDLSVQQTADMGKPSLPPDLSKPSTD